MQNAVLAAAGDNFGLLLRWLAELLRALIQELVQTAQLAEIAESNFSASSSRTTN
jgi:IS5 family transposase